MNRGIYITSSLFFLMAVVLSSLFIWRSYNMPWSPAAVVAIYSFYLLCIEHIGRSILTEHLKASPYYLGFLLTLISLFFTFRQSDIGNLGTETMLSGIVNGIAIAISTSVVGLIGSYLVTITDPTEREQAEVLSCLQKAFGESVASYSETLTSFLGFVNEFVDTHGKLLEEETNVSQQFAGSQQQVLETIKGASDALIGTVDATTGAMEVLQSRMSRISSQLEKSQLNPVFEQLQENVNGTRMALEQLALVVSKSKSPLDDMGILANQIGKDLEAVDALVNDFISVTQEHLYRLAASAVH